MPAIGIKYEKQYMFYIHEVFYIKWESVHM